MLLEQVSQTSCEFPIPEHQGQVGWGFEEHDLLEGAHGNEVGTHSMTV